MSINFMTDSFSLIPDVSWEDYCEKTLIPDNQFYFGSVLKGFKYFLETGREVERNKFGSHHICSPDVT